jgi:putative membrane protein
MMNQKMRSRFNWKVLIMSLLVNMTAIGITALILPNFTILDRRLIVLAVLAIGLGLLNTFIKPVLQLLTIKLLFVTYGLILIVTNMIILLLLNWLFSSYLEISSLWGAFFGGILIGLISFFLDYMFGVTPPIGYESYMKDLEVSA